jgi:hypothetical protein
MGNGTVQAARSAIPCMHRRSISHCIGTRMLLWEGNQILPAALLCTFALRLLCFLEGLGHAHPQQQRPVLYPLWENKAHHAHALTLTPTQHYSPTRGRRERDGMIFRERRGVTMGDVTHACKRDDVLTYILEMMYRESCACWSSYSGGPPHHRRRACRHRARRPRPRHGFHQRQHGLLRRRR